VPATTRHGPNIDADPSVHFTTSADSFITDWNVPSPALRLQLDSSAYNLEELLMVKTCAKLKKGQIESHPWPKNLSAAAFTYAFSTGVHLSTAAHPIVVRLITAIIRAMCPDMHFSSFILERMVTLYSLLDSDCPILSPSRCLWYRTTPMTDELKGR
ncbi:unnamed protein product, partial [Symbiodinium sp. KB8]